MIGHCGCPGAISPRLGSHRGYSEKVTGGLKDRCNPTKELREGEGAIEC